MRTTLTIEPDVAERLNQELASGDMTLKQVINERLRLGFGLKRLKAKRAYRVKPHHSAYRPGVDRTKLNQLVDELEAESVMSKRRPR